MKPIVTFVALFVGAAIAAAPPADKAGLPTADRVQTALDNLVRATTGTDWPSELAARKELTVLGPEAVPKVAEAAQSHGDARVRRACYELLTGAFAKDERAIGTVIQHGLSDKDPGIRYQCAFLLGDFKVQRTLHALRVAFDGATGKDDTFLRQILAKSLAQLGEADVLRTLYTAVADDAFMPRYVGNIGLKALSGKSLEDFEGYHYAEGAVVIGGIECKTEVDAITSAEKKAQRFQAAAAYFRWLKTERPELYKNVTYRRRR